MKIGVVTYGHTRPPEMASVPRNSVILTNYAALRGCEQVGEVVDFSPPAGAQTDWAAMAQIPSRLDASLEVLYCQAAVSLAAIQRYRELRPDGLVILQRDSTHAAEHLSLMEAAMERHGVHWEHFYAAEGGKNLRGELAEYDLADRVFVLSRWVRSTFERRGLARKVVQFASQCSDLEAWPPLPASHERPKRFTAVFAGQLGLRKGTLDLLAAWRSFYRGNVGARLVLAGLPEQGAPNELHRLLEDEIARTPGLEAPGWVPMDRMRDAYAAAHVLVMPSVEEGSTMTGVEAALCGLPIIATENAGIDLLETRRTGWVVPVGDPGALAEALRECAMGWLTGHSPRFGEEAERRARRCGVEAFSAGVAAALRVAISTHRARQ